MAASHQVLEFGGLTVEILLNHKSNLEGYSVVELTKIKAGELSDLLKTVNEGVSVYEELSGGFGNVEVVLEEALYGHKSFTVERLKRSLLEYFLEEDLTKSGGELINKSADAEVLVRHNGTLNVKYLAYFKSNSCFLVSLCKILELFYDRGNTDKELCTVLGLNLAENVLSLSLESVGVAILRDLLNYYYVLLADINNVVLGFIGNDILNNVVGSNLGSALELDNDNRTGLVVAHVELVRLDVNIIGKDVVKNNVLDEGTLVILLVIKALDVTKRDSENVCSLFCILILTLNKNNALALVLGVDKLIGVAVLDEGITGERELLFDALSGFSDLGELAASNDEAVLVDSTDVTAYDILHLMDYRLE